MKSYFTEEQEKRIIYLYTIENRGQLYCAKACGSTNVAKVKEVLHKYNIPIRDFAHAASLSNQNRAYKKNEAYFDTPSANMAWLLGFLASDGSVSSSDNAIKLGLSSKDREILERIKEEVEIENKINDYTTTKGYNVSELVWSCKRHKDALAKYSIIPKKTFTLIPPHSLPREYWIDYIRGYFDGDGSVNLIHNHDVPYALRWQICSATPSLLIWVMEVLETKYGIPTVAMQACTDKNLYEIQYSTNATRKIYSILYKPNTLFLKRKYDHFTEILQMI